MIITKGCCKKLLLVVPVIILILLLLFIEYSLSTLKNTVYRSMYNANTSSIKQFSQELEELSTGYTEEECTDLFSGIIHLFSDTLGNEYAVVAFMVDENEVIHHSNDYNKQCIDEILSNNSNMHLFRQSLASVQNGELHFDQKGEIDTLYYQSISNGRDQYHIYMSINRRQIELELNADKIILPICIIGIFLILVLEYMIWMKSMYKQKNEEE